ncbi:hypothetical protein N7456_010554 [Penicillium angulare]|uniref:Uncharacterized protein n=1 Tax=Penicillium angulare TaxID=116970 RepID=A0A9W9K695_9EURO|nr:hypothetical protein N7456_010554 [Penicillium angulare]
MRSFILSGAVLLISLASLGLSSAVNLTERASGDQWARFCSDDSCNDNCSIWFDLSNDGCFDLGTPGSYEIKGNSYSYHMLVESADGNCPCQTSCVPGNDNDYRFAVGCHKLDADYKSFRFVTEKSGGCDVNNC